MSDSHFAKEVINARRINELRTLIKFLVENGMFSNAVIAKPTFKTALAIADEQRELESPTPLWKTPKEIK